MKEVLYNTKYLQLKSTSTQNGNAWIYAHRPNANDVVVILPATETEVLFIIEERPPMQAEGRGIYTIGLAAGLVGDERIGETIEAAINAELLEETGLIAEKIQIKAHNIASSAGCVSETFTIAIAHINNKKQVKNPVSDGGIIIDRIWVNKNKIADWLKEKSKEGYILTSQALAALYYLEQ